MQPSEFETAISQQSWEWLLDVARRLEVAIEVIDARDVPLLPIGSTPTAAAIRRIVAAPPASLSAAISNVRRSGTPTSFAVDGFQGLCVGLSSPGVLLIARTLAPDESDAECLEDLGCLGAWLTRGIDAALANPAHTISEEPYRISSLTRILGDAAASASARRVLGAFVEALGVWDNVRIRGYAAGAHAGFFHVVSPIGAVSSSVPTHLEDDVVNLDGRMVRIARAEADRLGFASEPGAVLMLPLFTGAARGWLLVFSGAIDAAEQGRLTFYSEILRETLEDAFGRLANRLSAVMPQHRLGPNESLESGAEEALEHLTAAVGGHEAALVVTTVTGIRALALGNTNLLQMMEQDSAADRVVATSSDTASVMTVVVSRHQRPFTAFEREILNAGIAVLHPWIQAALGPRMETDRRRQCQPVESLFDQLAETALEAGQQASVIVASVNPASITPALLHSWLGSIRGQLRAGDFAGMLSDSEIAVLLCDASADDAAVVSSRLKQLIETEQNDGVLVQPVFSATTRTPESPFEGSLVRAARAGVAAAR